MVRNNGDVTREYNNYLNKGNINHRANYAEDDRDSHVTENMGSSFYEERQARVPRGQAGSVSDGGPSGSENPGL